MRARWPGLAVGSRWSPRDRGVRRARSEEDSAFVRLVRSSPPASLRSCGSEATAPTAHGGRRGGFASPSGRTPAGCQVGCGREDLGSLDRRTCHARHRPRGRQWRAGTVEATRLLSAIGRRWVQALELGNEPELYSAFASYLVAGRRIPDAHEAGTSPSTCRSSRGSPARSLGSPLAGPAGGSRKWMAYVGRFCRRATGPDRHASPLSAAALLRDTGLADTRRSDMLHRRPEWPRRQRRQISPLRTRTASRSG